MKDPDKDMEAHIPWAKYLLSTQIGPLGPICNLYGF